MHNGVLRAYQVSTERYSANNLTINIFIRTTYQVFMLCIHIININRSKLNIRRVILKPHTEYEYSAPIVKFIMCYVRCLVDAAPANNRQLACNPRHVLCTYDAAACNTTTFFCLPSTDEERLQVRVRSFRRHFFAFFFYHFVLFTYRKLLRFPRAFLR